MIDTTGYFNNNHRIWSLDDIKPCLMCYEKNKDEGTLEMFLRFKMHYLLKIENDNFTQKFCDYKGIEFIFKNSSSFNNNNNNIIDYIVEQKLTLGVGFRMKNFTEDVNTYTSYNFIIPILAFGKMWEIVFDKLLKKRKQKLNDNN